MSIFNRLRNMDLKNAKHFSARIPLLQLDVKMNSLVRIVAFDAFQG